MNAWRDPYPVRAGRWIGIILLSLVLAAGLAGAALAQAKKGTPPAAQKGAAPQGAPKAAGQNGDPGSQPVRQAAPIPRDAINPAEQMRALVSSISAYARTTNPDFVVVTMGGLELFEKIDQADSNIRAPAVTYMRTIDGVIVRNINFRPPLKGRDETKTDDQERAELIRLADLALRRGVRVWSMDYAKDVAMAQTAIRNALSKSYVPFPVTNVDYRFGSIPKVRPINENPNNIAGLNHVKNFLMLTDSSAWDTQEEFALAAAETNYDAIVVDVYHRRRTPLSPSTVDDLKYKKLGARRLVLAWMNIGEAETDRYYWKAGWREGSPYFVGTPAPTNPDKYSVQFWQPAWREIITGNANSYLHGIVAQGFDGVVLDGVDAYRGQESEQ